MNEKVPPSVSTFFPNLKPVWPKALNTDSALNHIDQIAIVVRSIDQAIEYYGAAFGWGPFYIAEHKGVAGRHGEFGEYHLRMAWALIGALEIELVEPLMGATPYADHLKIKGEGLFHLRLKTGEIKSALAYLSSLGIHSTWDCWIKNEMMSASLNSDARFGVRVELVRTEEEIGHMWR